MLTSSKSPKSLCILFFIALLSVPGLAAVAAPREITLKTEKVGEAVHWMPETIEVIQGETVKITAKHDLEGGFDFHGLLIPELKISETVKRNTPTVVTMTIPKTLAPGEYKIGCQFHEKHVPAKLVVKKAEEKKK